MTAASMARFIKALYREAGLTGASSHSGRRTLITRLAERGQPQGHRRDRRSQQYPHDRSLRRVEPASSRPHLAGRHVVIADTTLSGLSGRGRALRDLDISLVASPDTAAWPPTRATLLRPARLYVRFSAIGAVLEEFNRVPYGHEGFCFRFPNFATELFLEGHCKLDRIEAVGTEVVNKTRALDHLILFIRSPMSLIA